MKEIVTFKAKFIGQNGSMGFVNGKNYYLDIWIDDSIIWIRNKKTICPYETMIGMLKNWDFNVN